MPDYSFSLGGLAESRFPFLAQTLQQLAHHLQGEAKGASRQGGKRQVLGTEPHIICWSVHTCCLSQRQFCRLSFLALCRKVARGFMQPGCMG